MIWFGGGATCPTRAVFVGVALLMALTGVPFGTDALSADAARPFYVIAHRANSVEDVEAALAAGANAVEIDLRYDRAGERYCVNHDVTWFCDAENLEAFLHGVLPLARRYTHWAMIVFDVKDVAEGSKGRALLRTIRRHLSDHVPLATVISVPRLDMRMLFEEFGAYGVRLRANELVAIDQEDNPDETQASFRAQGIANQGYANGMVTYCFWCVFGWNDRILAGVSEALARRDANRGIGFVYVWTLGRRRTMAEYINLGVDGIIVDRQAIHRLLAELDMQASRVVLAPRISSPFAQ